MQITITHHKTWPRQVLRKKLFDQDEPFNRDLMGGRRSNDLKDKEKDITFDRWNHKHGSNG